MKKGRKGIKKNKHVHAMIATQVVVSFDDGTTQTLGGTPVVAPTDTEVELILSDGTAKVFIPKV